MTRVEKEMCERNGGPDGNRKAKFICALTLAWADGHVETFEGSVSGALVWRGRGTRGFGYDPDFQPNGHKSTFGGMAPAAKHAISHRAHAFEQLIDALDIPRSQSHAPLVQVMLALQSGGLNEVSLPDLSFSPIPVESTTA